MKKQKQKHEKRKLSSIILLMFLIIVMLSTATYAWFTSNKTVKVGTIEVNVEATSGLQISVDGFDWKAMITNDDISTAGATYTSAVNRLPSVVQPVSTAGIVSAGRMQMFDGVVAGDSGTGGFALSATASPDNTNVADINYVVFDVFLKVETDTVIYLDTDSNVQPLSSATTPDTGLKNASRVAFVMPWDDTEEISVSAATDANPITAFQAQVPTKSFIWEPNYNAHTQNAIMAASSIYNITTTADGPAIPYDGVKAAISTPILLGSTNATANPTYFQSVSPALRTNTTYSTALLNEQVFKLAAGVTKMRVYMWIEGQDVDCENNASGTDIEFNLKFNISPTPSS